MLGALEAEINVVVSEIPQLVWAYPETATRADRELTRLEASGGLASSQTCYKRNYVRYVATALGLCALVAGCGGGGNEFPTGNWEANVQSRAGSPSTAEPRLMRARAEYRADGTWEFFYRFEKGWTQTTSGLYSTTEDTITFEADSDCAVQRPHVEQGTYAWALDGQGRLILNAQYDPCPARVEDLDGNAYARVGPPPEP